MPSGVMSRNGATADSIKINEMMFIIFEVFSFPHATPNELTPDFLSAAYPKSWWCISFRVCFRKSHAAIMGATPLKAVAETKKMKGSADWGSDEHNAPANPFSFSLSGLTE